MRNLRGNNESIIAYKGLSRRTYTLFPIGRQRNVGGASVTAIEGPLRLAMADDEDTGGCHCCRREGNLIGGIFGQV